MKLFTFPDTSHYKSIETIDLHTAGEPLRVVTSGYPEIKGRTILEKRDYTSQHLDNLRRLIMLEPRGHADMYGALITEPERKDSDFGVLFIHNEGYSSMCGHGIIALLALSALTDHTPRQIRIDSPAGVICGYIGDKSAKQPLSFENVPSFVDSINHQYSIDGVGAVTFDVAFGGAYYAFVDADELGLSLTPDNCAEVIRQGKLITEFARENVSVKHPQHEELSFIYGTIFTSKTQITQGKHSRHACIFADGELDRSPTGTGVSARAALLNYYGELDVGEQITLESIIATNMQVTIKEQLTWNGKAAISPLVSGSAVITGRHQFFLTHDDVIKDGFLLR